jgi:hypothetical protein
MRNPTLSLLLSFPYSLITQVVNNELANQKLRLWIVLQVRGIETRFCKEWSDVSKVKMIGTHTHTTCSPHGLCLSVMNESKLLKKSKILENKNETKMLEKYLNTKPTTSQTLPEHKTNNITNST